MLSLTYEKETLNAINGYRLNLQNSSYIKMPVLTATTNAVSVITKDSGNLLEKNIMKLVGMNQTNLSDKGMSKRSMGL